MDQYFKDELENLEVEVLYNTKLESIDKSNTTMNLVDKDGNKKNVEFEHLYVHVPSKKNPLYEGLGISQDGI